MTNIETNGRISRRTFLKQLGLAGVLAGAPRVCVRVMATGLATAL
ncbi:MAG: twin-arginine translocation signal domain-containing protein [Prevotella sp.]|nr:twin-arginine translocation signal domain-containing protein [Prevotella sp.]